MLKTVTFKKRSQSLFRTSSCQGIYYSDSLNSEYHVEDSLKPIEFINEYREPAHGVCDGIGDLREHYDFEGDSRNIVVFLTKIRRRDQPSKDGWRWSRWGVYTGSQNVFEEYLYDEPEIDEIFVWNAFEVE